MNLYIFNSSGNWSQDTAYNQGEYNIYRLPDFNEFDGIILDLNNISSQQIIKEVVERAKNTSAPVISIANEIEDFYYVGINNYQAMREIISHLHKCHGCRSYWFVMGSEENYENRERIRALRDYMKEQKLSCSEQDFYFENYEFECGKHGFEHLLSTHKEKVPEVVICANDNIAVGVCEAASARGYHIPQDFCVTGFDDFDKASYFVPRISTMSYIREEIGYLCADIFLHLWAGETVPHFNYTKTKGVFWESCGCDTGDGLDDREHLKNQILYDIESQEFADNVLTLSFELLQCSTVEEMMTCIPRTIPSLRCDAMYLVLDEHMDFYKNHMDCDKNLRYSVSSELFRTEGYTNKMRVRFAFENDRIVSMEHAQVEGIFPLFEYPEGGKDFLFIPLHFREYTVGYFVIRNAVYLLEKQYLFQVINALNTALENLHKNEKLEYMNQTLNGLYVNDSLTGMYNRMGYQKFAEQYMNSLHEEGKSALILFVDLDRLKEINDNYGHEYGDFAIISASKAILKSCGNNSVASRTGGDEFIIIRDAVSMKEQEEMICDIHRELKEISTSMHFPVEMDVSIGVIRTVPESSRKLSDYVSEADEIMYGEKMKKK